MDDRFKHHPPKSDAVIGLHQTMREVADHFFNVVTDYCPDSREKAIAITKIEEAMMWANAAIARNQ
jgi:hypothetical protein